MSDFDSCPDLWFLIEWRTARAYEGVGTDECDERALFWYLTFYAKVAGDL